MVFADAPSCSAPHSSCKTTRDNATPADCASDLVGCYPYCLDGDAAPVTIQRMGILYTFSRADSLYSEWGADIRDIFDRATDSPETENTRYMLSARKHP